MKNGWMRGLFIGAAVGLCFLGGCKQPEVDPNSITAYIITYESEFGEVPEQIALAEGATLQAKHLPGLTHENGYFDFGGWYLEDEKIVPGAYEIESNITLTGNWIFNHYDYDETDYSVNVFAPTGNSDFGVDGEYTKINVKNTGISNFIISKKENGNNYELTDVYGFEFKIKCATNIKWAGLEWIDKPSHAAYFFEVYGDGSFKVQGNLQDGRDEKNQIKYKWATPVIDLKPEESHIIKEDFNTIKMLPTSNSDFEIYVNNTKVGTIKRDELGIIPGRIAIACTSKSKNKVGNAWFKLMSYKQLQ